MRTQEVIVSRQLGHGDVKVTANYDAVFSQDELAAIHDKFSPMKHLKSSPKSPLFNKKPH